MKLIILYIFSAQDNLPLENRIQENLGKTQEKWKWWSWNWILVCSLVSNVIQPSNEFSCEKNQNQNFAVIFW